MTDSSLNSAGLAALHAEVARAFDFFNDLHWAAACRLLSSLSSDSHPTGESSATTGPAPGALPPVNCATK